MTDRLTVKYHGEKVGTLSLTPDKLIIKNYKLKN